MLLAIGLLLGLFMLDSTVTLHSLNQESYSRHWTQHTYRVLLELGQAQRAAEWSEGSVRGYLLSPEPNGLSEVRQSLALITSDLARLRSLTSDNALQQTRLDHIDTIASEWRQSVQQQVIDPISRLSVTAATRSQVLAPIQDAFWASSNTRIGNLSSDLEQMAATEHALLAKRDAQLDDNFRFTQLANGVFAVLGLLLGLAVLSMTASMITRPLRRITDLMNRLTRQERDVQIRGVERRDEIGEIARALEVFKQMVIQTHDRVWLKGRIAEIAHNLQETTTHRDFGTTLTAKLGPLLQAGVGLFYSYDENSQRLDLLGSYGLRLGSPASPNYVPGEGLVGQCAQSRQLIELDEVPPDYVAIDSGSGHARPGHITILPVLLRDHLLGVFEVAGFHKLTPLQREMLDELLPTVALTLENLNRAVTTQDLLEQSREQANELRLSGVTLRQQQDALRTVNDNLHHKTLELEEQSQRLLASEEELRVQAEELQESNDELREKSQALHEQTRTLQVLQQETEQKAQELAQASRYKSEFLANMSHELRTPLNSLLILSHSLAENREGNLDAEQVESAQIIHGAGSSLLKLINDILDLSKIEAGKMELVLEDLPLTQFTRRLRRTFEHVARERSLNFTVSLDESLPESIHTDPTRLEQVINNLLSNAFKFTAEGSVQVAIGRPTEGQEIPAALADKPLLAIRVRDTGIGIPQDKQARVFNAFEQVDASTSRQYGGTGLGLSICRQMCALLGGELHLRSQPGEGSEFTVLLPERIEAPAATATTTDRETPAPLATPALQTPLSNGIPDDRERLAAGDEPILIVEDDLAFARILAGMVRDKGYKVLHAADGESGFGLARRYRPLGILLDVMLPGMDGWAVIERLKEDPATQHIPVHFLSATGEVSRGLELGAVGFLTKPVSREAIEEAFERLQHFAAGRTRRLLVVEDDGGARQVVRNLLRHDQVEIDEAGTAEQALEMIASTGYDCMVLDLGLPGLSGLELLERLAQRGNVPPVVIYSGRELSHEENLRLRQYTDSIVIKGARSPDRLLDEVSLFLHSIRRPGGAPAAPEGDPATDGELQGRRVLLVDDDMRNLFALSKVLRSWGLQVAMAQDGYKALQALDQEPLPELVLMDIMMPGMDGFEAIRAIREQPRLAALPVIALTAKAMRGDREQCLEAGANDYLSKPVDLDKLASMIRVWLRGSTPA
ncbi:response regulator [Dyella sp. A6]|uniref:response regulator n=1 Tax=Dyella aluminiiresistens TaxID=3069105 RepID=UPI002E76EF35|nr:response regulator [Dyella sp. A6]